MVLSFIRYISLTDNLAFCRRKCAVSEIINIMKNIKLSLPTPWKQTGEVQVQLHNTRWKWVVSIMPRPLYLWYP